MVVISGRNDRGLLLQCNQLLLRIQGDDSYLSADLIKQASSAAAKKEPAISQYGELITELINILNEVG